MDGGFYHVQMNVSDVGFYRALFGFLGYRVVDESAEHLGVSDGRFDLWIMQVERGHAGRDFHRKGVGLNHVALRVGRREEVDRFCREFLEPRGLAALYGGAKEYPGYRAGYYAVYFEDPDRIKWEVVYVPGEVRG